MTPLFSTWHGSWKNQNPCKLVRINPGVLTLLRDSGPALALESSVLAPSL